MSKVCSVCGKGPQFGNNVSHSNKRTKRNWKPNLKKVSISNKNVYVCSKCLKAGKLVH